MTPVYTVILGFILTICCITKDSKENGIGVIGTIGGVMPYQGGANDYDMMNKKRSWYAYYKKQLRCKKCKTIRNKKSWDRLLQIVDYCSAQVSDLELSEFETGIYHIHYDPSVKLNWFEASAYCQTYGLNLVSIESANENDILKLAIAELFQASATGTADTFAWTSLNSLADPTKWVWQGTGMPGSLLDWHTGQPTPGLLCGDIWYQGVDNTHWSSRDCATKSGSFICEMPQPCANVWPLFNKLTEDIIGSLDSSSDSCGDIDSLS